MVLSVQSPFLTCSEFDLQSSESLSSLGWASALVASTVSLKNLAPFVFAEHDGHRSPLFKRFPRGQEWKHASVNAGGYELAVGGGGINKEFRSRMRFWPEKYKRVHQGLLNKAHEILSQRRSRRSTVYNSPLIKREFNDWYLPVYQSYCRLTPELKGDHPAAGSVFIDVFTNEGAPAGESADAMVYVVPPDGRRTFYKDPKTYLWAIKLTTINLVKALNSFNKRNSDDPFLSVR
eukprot:Protomagalhaensia_wolfi_Nauph_80__2395@NODE_2578_length_1048_cov_15_149653_g2018_i0_p1_GENE_NODE_2578_length_1048_cov_15_149653_g2018_i0NODE_2578_length_1048_cov_15_149653_g2018_i0_p1_ORF_typecomplete_len234_score46_75PetN/PF03742_14/1_NODE_2578_length_1048_cov_15_149653_g2018_i059760